MPLNGALCALLLPGPAHGYQLQATLEAELGPLWETRSSQLYLTVGRMRRDGLVVATRLRQDTLPDRQRLELTGAGRALAHEWLEGRGAAGELVLRLAVARVVASAQFQGLAAAAVEERQATLHHLRSLRRSLAEGFQREALEFEIRRVEGEVRWAASIAESASAITLRPAASRRRRVAEDERLA